MQLPHSSIQKFDKLPMTTLDINPCHDGFCFRGQDKLTTLSGLFTPPCIFFLFTVPKIMIMVISIMNNLLYNHTLLFKKVFLFPFIDAIPHILSTGVKKRSESLRGIYIYMFILLVYVCLLFHSNFHNMPSMVSTNHGGIHQITITMNKIHMGWIQYLPVFLKFQVKSN